MLSKHVLKLKETSSRRSGREGVLKHFDRPYEIHVSKSAGRQKHAGVLLIHSYVTLFDLLTHTTCVTSEEKMLFTQSVIGVSVDGLMMQLYSTRWTLKLTWCFLFLFLPLTRRVLTARLWTPLSSPFFLSSSLPLLYITACSFPLSIYQQRMHM